MATTNTTKKAGDKSAKPQKQNKARVPDARPKLKARATDAEKPNSKSSVVKRPFSLPIPLFKFAQAEAKRIGKLEGKRPNVSGYLASLLFAAKHAAATPAAAK